MSEIVAEIQTDELGVPGSNGKHVRFTPGIPSPAPTPRYHRPQESQREQEFAFEKLFDSCFAVVDRIQTAYCQWLIQCIPAPQGLGFEQLEGILPPWYLSAIHQEIPEFLSDGEHISVATRPLRRRLVLSFLFRYGFSLSLFSILVLSIFGSHAVNTVVLCDFILIYMGASGTFVRCSTWLAVTDSMKVILLRPGWVASLSFGCIDSHGVRVVQLFGGGVSGSRILVKEYGRDGSGSIILRQRRANRRIVFHHMPGVKRFLRACQPQQAPSKGVIRKVEQNIIKEDEDKSEVDIAVDELFDDPNSSADPFAVPEMNS